MKNNMKKERIEWLDYLKSFTCFLVVLGHLMQSLQKAKIDNLENVTSFIVWFIYLFHMPLFMCMSGFLYCKKKQIFTWKNYKEFEFKKVINLLVPYFTFYLMHIGINMIFSSSVNTSKGIDDIIHIFNNPIAPYWFLYALLSIFIVVPIIEKIFNNNNKMVFAFFCILKLLFLLVQTPIYFINQIMSYGIYFYLGCFISKQKMMKTRKNVLINVFLIICYIGSTVIIYLVKNNINCYIMYFFNIFFAIAGILICTNLFKMIDKSIFLDSFKKYTFQIFVLHTLFAAGVRIILLKIGITNYLLHFIIGMLTSIYIPVLISIISNKILYTNFFFFPLKTIEEIKERNFENVRKKT